MENTISTRNSWFRWLSFPIIQLKWHFTAIKNLLIMENESLDSISELDIGYAVRSIRKKRKLSQEQLARVSNISQGFISYIEKGIKVPTIEILERIAKALSVPLYLLIYKAKTREKGKLVANNREYSEFLSLIFENFEIATDLFLSTSQIEKVDRTKNINIMKKSKDFKKIEKDLMSLSKDVRDFNNSLKDSILNGEEELTWVP